MVNRDVKKRSKTTWDWRTFEVLEKINNKNHEFIICRGVFEPKKKRILCNFSKFALKILFSPKYMANYAFGKCGF